MHLQNHPPPVFVTYQLICALSLFIQLVPIKNYFFSDKKNCYEQPKQPFYVLLYSRSVSSLPIKSTHTGQNLIQEWERKTKMRC